MSGPNIQFPQTGQPSAQKRAELPRQQTNLHEAVTRAFEVAQIIERAVCADTGETLEQFMNRVMNRFFAQTEGPSVRIGQASNMESLILGHLQVHDHAPCEGFEWKTEGVDYSSYPSGHPISLNVWVKSEEECSEVFKSMEKFGFAPDSLFAEPSYGFSRSEWRDRSELDSCSLADWACSILRNLWEIKAKKDIVCYFDQDEEESSRTLRSEEDLKKCLTAVSASEPTNATLNIYKGEDQILQIGRAMHGALRIGVSPTIAAEKIHSRIRALLENAGFVRDAEYGDDCWLGGEDADVVASVLGNVLRTAGYIVETGQLRADLHLKRRFV